MSIISGTATYLRAVRSAFGRIVAPDGSPAETKRKPPKEGFRPDIEGLRAVAVGAVLLYHVLGYRSHQVATSALTSSS
jgi:hypothetical protein